MSGCHTCGGFGNRHEPVAHGETPDDDCTCVPYPYGTGPEEDCPVHGRKDDDA